MRLGKFTALTGVILVSVAVIFGCSDDKSTTTPTVTYGSVDDPEFVPVKTQIDNTVSDIVADVVEGFDNLYVAPGDTTSVQAQLTPPATQPEPGADPDVLIATYENGWHHVYATYTGDVFYAQTSDSIRFEIDDVPVQQPTTEVDYLHYIDNWTFTALNQEVTHNDYTGRNDFEIANIDQTVAVINGSRVNTVETFFVDTDTTLTHMFTFNIDVTNLNVPRVSNQWTSACPQSGTLDIVLSNTWNWTNATTFGSGGTNWTVNVVFADGTATVTADNGETTWRYECDVCTIPSGQ